MGTAPLHDGTQVMLNYLGDYCTLEELTQWAHATVQGSHVDVDGESRLIARVLLRVEHDYVQHLAPDSVLARIATADSVLGEDLGHRADALLSGTPHDQ